MNVSQKIYLIIIASLGFLFAYYPSTDPDTFFHLASGQMILEHGVFKTEFFCLVSEGNPVINHEWLFDVFLYVFYEIFGDTGITICKGLLSGVLFLLVSIIAWERKGSVFISFLASLAILPLVRPYLEPRPHLLAYLLAGVFMLILFLGKRRYLYLLPVVTTIWANIHGSFILAPIMFGIHIFEVFLRERRFGVSDIFILSLILLSQLVNPWGVEIFDVVFHHLDPIYRALVPEWSPIPWGEEPFRDIIFSLIVFGTLLSFSSKNNRSGISDFILMLLFLIPAISSQKFLLGIANGCIPFLSANLTRLGFHEHRYKRYLLGVISMLCVSFTPFVSPKIMLGTGFELEEYPKDAVNFMKKSHITGRCFNPFHIGGYLEFVSWPDIKPFIDGRAYVHRIDGIQRYLSALENYESFKKLHKEYHFSIVLIDFTDPSFPRLSQGLSNDPEWALVYIDSRYAVFIPLSMAENRFHFVKATTDPRWIYNIKDEEIPLVEMEIDRILEYPSGEMIGVFLRGVLWLRRAGITFENQTPTNSEYCFFAERDLQKVYEKNQDIPLFRFFYYLAKNCTKTQR